MNRFRRVALTASGLALVGGVLVAGSSGRADASGVPVGSPSDLTLSRSGPAAAGSTGRAPDGIRWEDFRRNGIRWD